MSQVNPPEVARRFLPFGAFESAGDLRVRQHRNFHRLEEEKYQPDHVFQREKEAGNWPGDTEGRTVLALVLLAQATGRAPRYLDEILRRWPKETNERGYFGIIQPDGLISEQQLSGHGWVLRALSEYERWHPGGVARQLAQPILENLILPTAGHHRTYPLEPAARKPEGSFSGTHLGRVGQWLLSTDVGCDFICLDGVVDAYDAFGETRLRPVIEEMVARFLQLDLVAVGAQTHATLTGCRALLRWAALSGDDSLVAAVAERYSLYTRLAWTEHYSNFNWFGRPQWTEPCAIVDSLMVAMELWRRTGENRYLEDAQHIYFNGLGHAQRGNGGFGCDNCPGADGEDDLFFKVYEAHWCCTMRGGEGLSRLNQYCAARLGDRLLLPFGLSGIVKDEDWAVTVDSSYPYDPRVTIDAPAKTAGGPTSIELFIPSWWQDAQATDVHGTAVNATGSWLRLPVASKENQWNVTGTFASGLRPLVNPGAHKQRRAVRYRGPLVLAPKPDGGEAVPIFDAYEDGITDPAASRRRLLVPET